MSSPVAGHLFVGAFPSEQRCACGRWWTDICECTEADIGKCNFAHSGELNAAELSQIRAKRVADERPYALVGELVGVST
jgi:hypothetical protein